MATQQDDGGFGHSMTDLMASVAVVFLLIAAIFMVMASRTAMRERQKLAQAKVQQDTSLKAILNLRKELEGASEVQAFAKVEYDDRVDPFLLTIVVSDAHLHFESGDCVPSGEGVETIRKKLPLVLKPVCHLLEDKTRDFVEQITLEGHTDRQPFFGGSAKCGINQDSAAVRCSHAPREDASCARVGFENNVRLSGARAQHVYLELRRALLADPLLTSCLDQRFVVAGRGPVEPSDGSDWREERTDPELLKNDRRVVIKVRMRSDMKFENAPRASP